MPKFSSRTSGRSGVYFLFFLSLVFFLLLKIVPPRAARALKEEMIAASQIMSDASAVIRDCRKELGLDLDPETDINRTGLIGLKSSPITTSLGNLKSKRTSTNPNFAGLIVFLLRKAGVRSGDAIAVGASGSFPGLIVAVISAARAMGVEPLVISSLGSSQWGANHPRFHWLRMHRCLWEKGLFSSLPIAVSLGGNQDMGEDMPEEGRILLEKDMAETGIPVIRNENLAENVETRIRLFFQQAGERPLRAFVNVGGSWSNLGIDSLVLHVRPGLTKIDRYPPRERQGVLFQMAARGLPVIHLLYVRGLVQKYGLEWDPSPLPDPGKGEIYAKAVENQKSFWMLSLVYLIFFSAFLVWSRFQRRNSISGLSG
jgi:poly-gamma-glutamate system protein